MTPRSRALARPAALRVRTLETRHPVPCCGNLPAYLCLGRDPAASREPRVVPHVVRGPSPSVSEAALLSGARATFIRHKPTIRFVVQGRFVSARVNLNAAPGVGDANDPTTRPADFGRRVFLFSVVCRTIGGNTASAAPPKRDGPTAKTSPPPSIMTTWRCHPALAAMRLRRARSSRSGEELSIALRRRYPPRLPPP